MNMSRGVTSTVHVVNDTAREERAKVLLKKLAEVHLAEKKSFVSDQGKDYEAQGNIKISQREK